MSKCDSKNKLLRFLICYIVFAVSILSPSSSYAVYEGVRDASFNSSSNTCDTTDGGKYLAFDPFGNNVDYNFELIGNPICMQIAAGVGAATVGAWGAAKLTCRLASTCTANRLPAETEAAADTASGPITPAPSPSWLVKSAIFLGACSSRSANTATCCATLMCAAGTLDAGLCCAGAVSFIASITATTAALAIIHGKANQAYNTARVCGHTWSTWTRKVDETGTPTADGILVEGKGPYQLCLRNLFLGESNSNASGCGSNSAVDIKNKAYREYIYGGIEYVDDSGSCKNPQSWDRAKREKILGYSDDNQRYYMTGPGKAPVFACHRFLGRAEATSGFTVDQDQSEMQKAYDCCKQRSQNVMCIEARGGSRTGSSVSSQTEYKHKFCEIGSKNCRAGDIDYEIFESTKAVNYVCAKTYSACPYNHNLGGGTETEKLDDNGNRLNHCQYLKHCSKRPILPYVRTSNLTGAYIDSSCRDLRGDSQNVFGYTAELLPLNTRGFTAPIVQCVKETMQNMMLNKAGYTKCINPDELPNQNEECASGEEFVKGQEIEGKSFLSKIQERFQLLVRIVLTLSVAFWGAMLLFAAPNSIVERKKLFPYILKLALISYFTLGTAWQDVFIKDVLNASSYLSAITFKPDASTATNKLDGCQFPRYNSSMKEEKVEKYYPRDSSGNLDDRQLSYPEGKEYLEVWDRLDCKIALALGFGPDVSVPNLFFMILGGFLTAGYGIIFIIAAFSFAFFMMFLAVRAMQFFLVSMIAIVLLIYVSTFIIPLSLFERTKGIFSGWWKQMLGFILQPMILFAYLGVLIAIFDNIVIGSATFTPANVTIDGQTIVDHYGRVMPKTISCNSQAKDDSIYCIFRIADIKTYNGLEVLGIGLPMLASVNTKKLFTIMKGALLMFIFSKFMDKINEVAATLVGGSEISTGWADNFKPSAMAANVQGKLDSMRKAGMNAIKNVGGGALRKAGEVFSNRANMAGNMGKSPTKIAPETSAQDETGNRDDAFTDDSTSLREETPPADLSSDSKESLSADSTGTDAAPAVKEEKEAAENIQPEVSGGGGNAPRSDQPKSGGEAEEKSTKEVEEKGSEAPKDQTEKPKEERQDPKTSELDSPKEKDQAEKSETEKPKEEKDKKEEVERKDVEPKENKEESDKKSEEKIPEEKSSDKEKEDKNTQDSKPETSKPADAPVTSDNQEKQKENQVAEKEPEQKAAAEPTAKPEQKNTEPEKPKAEAPKTSEAKTSSGSNSPNYMKPTEASNSRNKATSEKFGVNATTPTSLDQPSSSGSSASAKESANKAQSSEKPKSANSSVKTANKSPSESGSSSPKAASTGGTPSYMRPTEASNNRNKATSEKFGVNATTPTSLDRPKSTNSSSDSSSGGSSVKAAAKSQNPSSNSSKASSPASSAQSTPRSQAGSSGGGSTSSSPRYTQPTASSAAKASTGGSSVKSAAKSPSPSTNTSKASSPASSAPSTPRSQVGSSGGGSNSSTPRYAQPTANSSAKAATGGSSVKTANKSSGAKPKNKKV